MSSEKCQNRDFLLSSPAKNTSIDNHPWMRVTFWKSRIFVTMFQHRVGAKNPQRLDTLKRVRGIVSNYLCQPSSKAAQLSAKDFLAWNCFHRGKLGCVSECLSPSSVLDADNELQFFLNSFRILSCIVTLEGTEGLRSRQSGLLNNMINMESLLVFSWTPKESPPMRPQNTLSVDILNSPKSTISTPHTSCTQIPTPWPAPCMGPKGGKFKWLQVASKHVQKTNQSPWDLEKAHKLEH